METYNKGVYTKNAEAFKRIMLILREWVMNFSDKVSLIWNIAELSW
jgi:hypothetical protein